MEKHKKELTSIWGNWWVPIRKWFYPTWLVSETSMRFYEYAQAVFIYFMDGQNGNLTNSGALWIQILATISGILTFVICTIFLTIPAGLLLYYFFKNLNLTGTQFEEKFKKIF